MVQPLPEAIDRLARRIAVRLVGVEGVAAVALGGSWARGDGDAASDVDLGLYYEPEHPPDLAALSVLAAELAPGAGAAAVTALGEWGPWVNGGAWLEVEGTRVDWLYRDLRRVGAVVDDCLTGHVTCDYYLGHPHGFHNHVYLGELHACIPLEDPTGRLAGLRLRVADYPEPMRAALIRRYRYDADFMLELARKPAARGDVFHVAGCLFRAAAALIQVLFAVERRYFTNEKGAVTAAASFACAPRDLAGRLAGLLGSPGATSDALRQSVDAMRALLDEAFAPLDS